MTESTTEYRTTGAKWWGSVFHKKKKKKKMVEILTECNARLTTMVEDQARLISSLTFENGRNDQIIRDYEQKINKLTDDIAKLEDKSKRDQEFLESQRDKLQHQYYDIQLLTSQKQDLSDTKISLEQEKCDLINHAKEREQEVVKAHETKQRLEDELTRLKDTKTDLQHDLTVSNQALYEETVTNKLMKKDYTLLEDSMTDIKTARNYADRKVDELQKALLAVTSEKYKVENELGAQNECLKYELVMMKRMTDRKRKKIAKLERDKQLILQYYLNQETDNTRFHVYGFQNMHLEMSTFTDVPYAELLKNKVLNLEGQLYRRCQLTDELCDVIREYDPEFDLHECLTPNWQMLQPTDELCDVIREHDPEFDLHNCLTHLKVELYKRQNGSYLEEHAQPFPKRQNFRPVQINRSCRRLFQVLNLEGQLYRRCQLTDELCDVIREYDPEFDLHDCPVLNQYLDSETMLGDGYDIVTDYQHTSIQNNPAVCRNDIPMSPEGSLDDCESHTTITSTSLDGIDNHNDNQSANTSCRNQLSICVNNQTIIF